MPSPVTDIKKTNGSKPDCSTRTMEEINLARRAGAELMLESGRYGDAASKRLAEIISGSAGESHS